jgi:hypothetical protein
MTRDDYFDLLKEAGIGIDMQTGFAHANLSNGRRGIIESADLEKLVNNVVVLASIKARISIYGIPGDMGRQVEDAVLQLKVK